MHALKKIKQVIKAGNKQPPNAIMEGIIECVPNQLPYPQKHI